MIKNDRPIILYGTGNYAQDAWFFYKYFHKKEITYVFDDYSMEKEFHRIPVISRDQFLDLLPGSVTVIAVEDVELRDEIVSEIRMHGGDFTLYMPDRKIPYLSVHCCGVYPEIVFKANTLDQDDSFCFVYRARCTADMMLNAMKLYESDFVGKKIDFWYTLHDQAEYEGLFSVTERYFAYSTTYAYQDKIIPIPDYKSYFNKGYYPDPENEAACREAASRPYTDKRAFFVGTPGTNRSRKMLVELGRKHPDYLDIRVHDKLKQRFNRDGSNDFIPMLDWTRYKYLIDAPGFGWTDRTKLLLRLGRPLLMIDRMDREWYFDRMEPMVHYVPIKADLSDLIEKIDMLEEEEKLYDQIVNSALGFADEYLSCDSVNSYVREVLLKYGVDR